MLFELHATASHRACVGRSLRSFVIALAGMASGLNLFGQIYNGDAYTIVNLVSGQAVDDPGASGTAGQQMQEWGCDGYPQQNWIFYENGGGPYWIIVNEASGLALSNNGAQNNGGAIVQEPRNGSTTQNWLLTSLGSGFYTLKNENSGKVLDLPSGSLTNGTLLQQWQADGYPQQNWYITSQNTCRTGQVTVSTTQTTFATAYEIWGLPTPQNGTNNIMDLFGTISLNNSEAIFAEELFVVAIQAPVNGTCPTTLPPFPGNDAWGYIVKSVTAGTTSIPIDYWIKGGLGLPSPSGATCLTFWVTGGTPSFAHAVSGTLNLAAIWAPYATSAQSAAIGGEYSCTTSGCTQGSNGPANGEAYNIGTASTLYYIWGDVSNATYPLPAPSGAWDTTNNLYLADSQYCKPGYTNSYGVNFNWTTIPPGVTLLASYPQSGNGDAVGEQTILQTFNTALPAGDCLVLLTGVSTDPGNATFDNELQIRMMITPN
jgi:hypothetical protein